MPPKKQAAPPRKPKGALKKVMKHVDSLQGLALIGTVVHKEFDGHGSFTGRVVDFERATGFFKVVYDDGDDEELSLDELTKLITKKSALAKAEEAAVPAAAATTSRRVAPRASTTLAEYLKSSATAARRKRKHTDLVRKGVFKERQAAAEAKQEAIAKADAEAAEVAAAAVASRELNPPPAWAAGLSKERRFITFDPLAGNGAGLDEELLLESMYRLQLEAHDPHSVTVRWWYPPANPGNHNAWICLFNRDEVHWHESSGACVGKKLQWRLITTNGRHGAMKWTIKGADGKGDFRYPDGQYVFTMQIDYGTTCRAVTDVLELEGGRVARVLGGTGLMSECMSMVRKHRQREASLGLQISTHRKPPPDAADADEPLDERCYFPLTSINVACREDITANPLIKMAYRVVDKESFLDWGLSSDYTMAAASDDGGGDGKRRRRGAEPAAAAAPVAAPAAAPVAAPPPAAPAEAEPRPPSPADSSSTRDESVAKAENSAAAANEVKPKGGKAARGAAPARRGWVEEPVVQPPPMSAASADKVVSALRGLGGGTKGSEGYGEPTTSSAHRVGVVLANLRKAVLTPLHAETAWGLLWDLGPHSTFLDIGSGYGKVVLHFKLLANVRKSVGVECVLSRHQIAEKSLSLAASEADAAPTPTPPLASAESSAATAVADADMESGAAGSSEVVPVVKARPFDGCSFVHGDATLEAKLSYTHLYIFDWVFSPHTLKAVAQVLQNSDFFVLVSFRKVAEWWSYGLVKIQPVASIQGFHTTGKEGMTGYVYINVEKIPQPNA